MNNYQMRNVFDLFYPKFREKHHVSPEQESASRCIMNCKTGALGYTRSVCPTCGSIRTHYASCGNRNCPNCQGTKPAEWVAARTSETIEGLTYFHVVLTVPEQLNPLFLSNAKVLYTLLMHSAADAVKEVSLRAENLDAIPGMILLLHTWGQTLQLHPHIHMLISGGGLNASGLFVQCKNKHFFCPEAHLAGSFRQHFLDGLKKLKEKKQLCFSGTSEKLKNYQSWQDLLTKLYETSWNVFLKETLNGNGNAIEYFARYAYRTAIANSRILSVSKEGITFSWKDYRDHSKKKTMTLSGEEFIRRFLMHILPKGFSRIRYGGYLSNACRKKNLERIRLLTKTKAKENPLAGMNIRQKIFALYHKDICKCPDCGGMMNIHLIRGNGIFMQC